MFDYDKYMRIMYSIGVVEENVRDRTLEEDDHKTAVVYNLTSENIKDLCNETKDLLSELVKERTQYLDKLDAVITKFMKEDKINENY